MLDDEGRRFAVAVSSFCGWVYVLCWSLSFYPQPTLNIQRRTTHGLTPDFPLLNVIGFASYAISSVLFKYNAAIKSQYAERHPLSPETTVRFNDVAFGVHAFVICCVTYSQFWPRLWGWKQTAAVQRNVNKFTLGLVWGGMIGVAITIIIVFARSGDGYPQNGREWAWIDVVYSLTYVKLMFTLFKYLPQAISNFRRKSTAGWAINQILLDSVGGVLSLVQLVIDSALQADWSGLVGNPVKFGLANISLLFDVVFILQHFVLYGPVEEKDDAVSHPNYGSQQDREPLLP